MFHQGQCCVPRVVQGDPAQASTLEKPAELIGVLLRVHRFTEDVGHDILATRIRGSGVRRLLRLCLRSTLSASTKASSSGSVRKPFRDIGSSIRTWYSTSTRDWLTVSVLPGKSMSAQRRPRTSPRRSP